MCIFVPLCKLQYFCMHMYTKVQNEEVREKPALQELELIRVRRLRWFGHVLRPWLLVNC